MTTDRPQDSPGSPVPGLDAQSLTESLRGALDSATLEPCDGAAVRLALVLAAAIDGGGDLDKLSGRLLAALAALRMTPAARMGVGKGGSDDGSANGPADALAALRARRSTAR